MTADCIHPNFDADGVCTVCKELYRAEHDQNPMQRPANHPAVVDLVAKAGYFGKKPWTRFELTRAIAKAFMAPAGRLKE
jgi:hypothetical protein